MLKIGKSKYRLVMQKGVGKVGNRLDKWCLGLFFAVKDYASVGLKWKSLDSHPNRCHPYPCPTQPNPNQMSN